MCKKKEELKHRQQKSKIQQEDTTEISAPKGRGGSGAVTENKDSSCLNFLQRFNTFIVHVHK